MKIGMILFFGLMAAGAVHAGPGVGVAADMLLAHVGECLDVVRNQAGSLSMPMLVPGSGREIGLRQVASTLGIGALTVLFFVPTALVSELLMRRGDSAGESVQDV